MSHFSRSASKTLSNSKKSSAILAATALCSLMGATTVHAATITYPGPGVSNFTNIGWSDVGAVPTFSVAYAHQPTAASFTLFGGVYVSSTVSNPSDFNSYPSINGNAGISLSLNNNFLDAAFPFASQSYVLPPHTGPEVLSAANSTSVTGALSLASLTPGSQFEISGPTGSGGSVVQSIGSVNVTYTYTPIGLTQSDPILATPNGSTGQITFNAVPSGRWFDPVSTSAYQYSVTSPGDSFTEIDSLPTGFANPFDVTANGIDLGQYTAGQSISFPANTHSFIVSDINPSVTTSNSAGFPIELSFNRDGVTFTATPINVPEPTCTVACAASLILFRRKRRNML